MTMSNKKEQSIEKVQGRAMLRWDGKKPLERIEYFPAQEKEVYGDKVAKDFNKLFWGDNLQVLSHLLKEYRGKIDLIYIDPPFDSEADYVKQVKIRGEIVTGEQGSLLEEKQYSDIWAKDQYLEFMYERLILLRELLTDKGSFYLHCDWAKAAHLKLICDEIFGDDNFRAAITWQRSTSGKTATKTFIDNADIILHFSKSNQYVYNPVFKELSEKTKKMYKYDDKDGRGKYRLYPLQKTAKRTPGTSYDYTDNDGKLWRCPAKGWRMVEDKLRDLENDNRLYKEGGTLSEKAYWNERENEGKLADNIWADIPNLQGGNLEMTDYPTQKPEALLERIIRASSSIGDVVFDCFCGSGTTMAAAQKLGRRWIGCDINIGAIQTSTKRLGSIVEQQNKAGVKAWLLEKDEVEKAKKHTLSGFKIYNVNEYDVFKNEVEAKDIIMEMYGVERIRSSHFDGVLDNHFVKVMPINRVCTKKDIDDVLKGIKDSIDDFKVKSKSRQSESIYEQGVMVFCSGMELDTHDYLKKQDRHGVDIYMRDILLDKQTLIFKQKPEAEIDVKAGTKKATLTIEDFISPILMRKLDIENEKALKKESRAKVEDYKQIIDSVAIDIDYDGKLFNAEIIDVPAKNELIEGSYELEYEKAGKNTIAIKIVDVLGEEYFETFEVTV
jgi:adenine-specific DNA-methyltransferase